MYNKYAGDIQDPNDDKHGIIAYRKGTVTNSRS